MTSKRVADIRLEPEHETLLWETFRVGHCHVARQTLVEAYLPYARILCAKLFASRSYDEFEFEDYFQYASIGLLEAIDRFDPSRGAQFRTYAAHRIQGAMLNGLERLSERRQQMAARRALLAERVEHSTLALENVNDGEAVLRALAEIGIGLALGFMLEDSAMYDSGERSFIENGYERLELRQLRERTAVLVKQLPPRESNLIAMHYLQGMPFEEIARQWGLTKGRISQLHRQALNRLKEYLNADRLCDLEF